MKIHHVAGLRQIAELSVNVRQGSVTPADDAASIKVDIRLPGKGNPNSHGARPVHEIIMMIKWTVF